MTEDNLDPRVVAVLPDLDAAYEHHQAGRLHAAEPIYEDILRRVPDLADARYLLGMLTLARGQAGRAVELIAAALPLLPPDFAEGHFSLGNAQAAAGDAAAAEACYRRAITLAPAMAVAHCNLARMLNQRRAFTEALECCKAALFHAPEMVEALLNQAAALRGLGHELAAEAPLREALGMQPERVETLAALSDLLCVLQRREEALPLQERAVALSPADARLHLALGDTLFLLQQVPEAREHIARAVALAPAMAEAWVAQGRVQQTLGHFDAAQACFDRALSLNPDLAAARWNAVWGRRNRSAENEDAARFRAVLADPAAPVAARITAGFGLGKILDDADAFDDAFACFAEANAVFLNSLGPDAERFDAGSFCAGIERLIAQTPKERFQHASDRSHVSELPVFVLGMPRSGTTLVEQIAASHSRVFGAGELAAIRNMQRKLAMAEKAAGGWHQGDGSRMRRMAAEHLRVLDKLGNGAARVIDKTPDNVLRVHLIASLFPGARVIYVHRDPRDCGLSNFFQFYTEGNRFAFDLADLGVRLRETERLALHWRDVAPVAMLKVDYEALVRDLEGESRRIIAFLGLDWEPACLAFHRTERAVTTPSNWQVRQPIYTRSVGRWRHYEGHLGPMIQELANTGA